MQPNPTDLRRGLASAVCAYLIWGLVLPLYMKALSDVPPFEVVAHRIVWALPFALLLLAFTRRLRGLRRYLTIPMMARAALCAMVISVNWGVYVYAIGTDQTVDAALGYYINPLVSLGFGIAFLGERPSRAQWAAIALAAFGVLVLTVETGGLPWISLALAVSFGVYGLLRKIMPFGPVEGFVLEVIVLCPLAIAVLALTAGESAARFVETPLATLLFVGLGPVTAVPLILYATGARKLTLGLVGVLQYMVPTILFLMAVFLFDEPFGTTQLVAFAFIWMALALYTSTLLRAGRAARTAG